MKKSKKKYLILLLLFVISIGYAFVSSNISLNGIFNVSKSKYHLYIDSVDDNVESTVNYTSAPNIVNDNTGVEFSVTLDKPTDYYSIYANIVNDGTIDAMVKSITISDISEEYADYIIFNAEFDNSPEISANRLIEAGSTDRIKVEVLFDPDITELPENSIELNLSVEFEFVMADKNAVKVDSGDYPILKNIDNTAICGEPVPEPEYPFFPDEPLMEDFADESEYWEAIDEYYMVINGIQSEYDEVFYQWSDYNDCLTQVSEYLPNLQGYARDSVSSINILTNVESLEYGYVNGEIEAMDQVDLSENEDESIVGYVVPREDNNLDFYIVTKSSKIYLPEDCTRLFAGYNHANFNGLNKLDSSLVTNMYQMFDHFGIYNFEGLHFDVENWNVSNVEDMTGMFAYTGGNNGSYVLDLSRWKPSSLKIADVMFDFSGAGCTIYDVNLSGWNTSNLESMLSMFSESCKNATSYKVNLTGWNLGKVTSLRGLFQYAASNSAGTIEIAGIGNWDTSKIKNMSYTFHNFGKNATYTLDLSKWNTSSVTEHNNFNGNVSAKVIAPTFNN